MGDVVDAIEPIGQRGFAEARMRWADQTALPCQKRVDGLLWIEAPRAMKHQRWRAATDLGQLKIDACDINHTDA